MFIFKWTKSKIYYEFYVIFQTGHVTLFSIPQDIQIHQDLHKSHSRQSPMVLEVDATPSKMADGLTMNMYMYLLGLVMS